jgi:PAS domain S-box-containing protein
MTVNFQPNLVGTVTNRCQKLLDRISSIAWIMTDQGEIIAVNQQWYKYVEQHNLTQPDQITELLYGEDLQSFSLAWNDSKELQGSLEKKLRLKSISGDGEWFQIEAEPEIDEFAQVTWIGTATRLGGETVFPNQSQSTQFLEALLDYASDGIVACDASGHLVLFNRAAQSFHGLPPEPIDPEEWANYYDLYDSDGINILAKSEIPLFQALEEKIVISQEMMIKSKQGKDRSLLASGAAIYSTTGEKLGAVVLMRDITEYKRAMIDRNIAEYHNSSLILIQEQLKKQNEELDSFVHMVSHDLKSPLRAIANLSIWIEEDLGTQIGPGSQQQLLLLRQRVQRMDALIDGLLRYSKVGRQALEQESVDIAQLLSETIDSLSPPENFNIDILSPLPTIMARKILLSQVFANLLSNAIKHHDRADGRIAVSAEDLGDRYQFSIADDGPGIPNREDQKRIFEVFHTLKPSISNENTGIGLALVKKIVEGEGGQIWLDNQQIKGTCFCFTWVHHKNSSNLGSPTK